MPNTHSTLTSLFSDIADSIRAKTGDTADIVADDFPDAIDAIPSGGGGGITIRHGVVIPSANVDQIPLFNVAGKTAENVPDFVMVAPYPDSTISSTSTPEADIFLFGMNFRNRNDTASSGIYFDNYIFGKSSSNIPNEYMMPYVSKEALTYYSNFIKGTDNTLYFPFKTTRWNFKAGQKYYYMAVYAGEDLS